jgi:rhodanese-related sulfurtransferase
MLFIVLLLMLQAAHVDAAEFPGRSLPEYKGLKTIEIDELHQGLQNGKVSVVDVRSKLEFDTIHIKDALHAAVTGKEFTDTMKEISIKAPGKKIAFY